MPGLTQSATATCHTKPGVHRAHGEVSPGKGWHGGNCTWQEGWEEKKEPSGQRKEQDQKVMLAWLPLRSAEKMVSAVSQLRDVCEIITEEC